MDPLGHTPSRVNRRQQLPTAVPGQSASSRSPSSSVAPILGYRVTLLESPKRQLGRCPSPSGLCGLCGLCGFFRKGPRDHGPPLDDIRTHCAEQLSRLLEPLRRLKPGAAYPVEVADSLRDLAVAVDREPQ